MGGQTAAAKTATTEPAASDTAAIVAALVADGGFVAAISDKVVAIVGDRLVGDERFASLVSGELVDDRLRCMLATDEMGAMVRTSVADMLDQQLAVKITGALHTDETLARFRAIVAEEMPETDAQRAERLAEEAAERARDKTRADRRAARKADDAERDRKAARADARAGAAAFYREHEALRGGGAPIDLNEITRARMLVDDGDAISIDVSMPVDPAKLSIDDMGAVVLRHEAITLGDEVPDLFVVRGVMLHLDTGITGVRTRTVRCAIPMPLAIGGGATAQFPADSLIFRDR